MVEYHGVTLTPQAWNGKLVTSQLALNGKGQKYFHRSLRIGDITSSIINSLIAITN